ncbi:MAG TPA: tRNA (N6-isopentenyl adenosine(37)-C2)-methylthiotransferase MiaB [Magnetospirillaceae bacterium]
MPKKLFIRTYGCQMNAYDSARMAEVLAPMGYAQSDVPEGADLVIINTCHIREHASEKVFSELGRLRELKAERASGGENMLIAVAGCVAQAEGKQILARAPYVDIVLGPQTYHRLPAMVAAAGTRAVVDCEFPPEPKFDHLPAPGADGPSAFLSVQEGCDKFCTFCVVPYTRGAEYSRPAAAILKDARGLADQGVVEITLLGQNVNAWHGDGIDKQVWGLGRLIRALAEIPGLARIRYTTSHPLDMDDALIAAHGEVDKLMPFLHLPVQSGSDRILAAMNRKHRAEDYLRIVEKLRAARSDLALSSDFIVGFPGETEDDFAQTLDLIRTVGFASAYAFKYSPRPGTPAADLDNQISAEESEARHIRLLALLSKQSVAFNQTCIGRTMDVLLDRPGRRAGQLGGRSPYMQAVHVHAPAALLNTVQPLRIVAAYPNSLTAEIVEERACA